MPRRQAKRRKIIFLDIVGEFISSTIYTFLFFLFLHRYSYSYYEVDAITLSVSIGLSYFAIVYLTHSKYRVHIFPVITLVIATIKGEKSILFRRIPTQILGSIVGVFCFCSFVSFSSELVNIDEYYINEQTSTLLLFASNFFTTFILVFVYLYVRDYCREQSAFAYFSIGSVIAVLFYLNHTVFGVSTINPFGLTVYSIIVKNVIFLDNLFSNLMVHIISYIFGAFAALTILRKGFVVRMFERLNGKRLNG